MPSVNHIVLLSPGFARDEEDSTCLPFLQDYSLAFHRLHPEVDLNIVTLQYPFDRAAYFWKGVPVYSAQGRNNRFPFRFGTWYKVWKQLNKLHRAKKINVLHTFWLTEATLIGKLFCRLKGIKLVAYSIGQDTLPQNKYLKLLGLRKDEIITMSQRLRDNLSGLGIPSGKIIPLGIELLKFSTQKGDRTLDLIGIGALTELKNYSLFIDLVAALRETHPAIRTEIIGEGPQESLLRQQILNLGLSGQITL
ncbi:MAG TPA: glycosyltransferase, partial [Bacteroidia bacterium]|nr:glycosyltransferase [Bacteroidia bacterium]